jgi:membrane complex biogenesis BtpA family protein
MTITGLIGVVHLPPLPGDPRHHNGDFDAVEAFALRDAEALATGGVEGLVVENFGSVPFVKGTEGHRVPPHHVAFLAQLVRKLVDRFAVPIGVNCLRSDAYSSLGVAAAAGASFIRVNVHTGAYVTDQGVIEGEAAETLRYRQQLGASHVSILADVLVKHAAPLAPITPEEATHDCVERGLADGVIVTGSATGAPVDADLLGRVATAANGVPVLVGSGLTPDNADALVPHAHGAIVGTWLKQHGDVHAKVDRTRVAELATRVRGRWRKL